MTYEILYNEIKIGILEINAEGRHRYTPDAKGVEAVKDEAPLTTAMKTKSDWIEPIPFFKNRINNAKRFSKENDIRSHTDKFRMVALSS